MPASPEDTRMRVTYELWSSLSSPDSLLLDAVDTQMAGVLQQMAGWCQDIWLLDVLDAPATFVVIRWVHRGMRVECSQSFTLLLRRGQGKPATSVLICQGFCGDIRSFSSVTSSLAFR